MQIIELSGCCLGKNYSATVSAPLRTESDGRKKKSATFS